jgi:hypothetical protein
VTATPQETGGTPVVHGSLSDLIAARARLHMLGDTAGGLVLLGREAVAAELLQEAGTLAATRFYVPVRCITHAGIHGKDADPMFEAEVRVNYADMPGPGICGPCSAHLDAEVARQRAE